MRIETMGPMTVSKDSHDPRMRAPINPFCQDSYHMGTTLGINVTAMYANHPDRAMRYVILVDTITGERIKVWFD